MTIDKKTKKEKKIFSLTEQEIVRIVVAKPVSNINK